MTRTVCRTIVLCWSLESDPRASRDIRDIRKRLRTRSEPQKDVVERGDRNVAKRQAGFDERRGFFGVLAVHKTGVPMG